MNAGNPNLFRDYQVKQGGNIFGRTSALAFQQSLLAIADACTLRPASLHHHPALQNVGERTDKSRGSGHKPVMARNRWDDEQIEILKGLIGRGISLARAAVIMKRPQSSVQIQARKLGTPFPGLRATKALLKARTAEAEKALRR